MEPRPRNRTADSSQVKKNRSVQFSPFKFVPYTLRSWSWNNLVLETNRYLHCFVLLPDTTTAPCFVLVPDTSNGDYVSMLHGRYKLIVDDNLCNGYRVVQYLHCFVLFPDAFNGNYISMFHGRKLIVDD